MTMEKNLFARRLKDLLPIAFFAALGFYALYPWLPLPGRAARPQTIIFYGFSILGEVMNEGVFPAFQADWQARTGERVEFISSFAGSGTVTNQMLMGVPADMALVSLELDAQRLGEARVTTPNSWRELPYKGVVNRTPFIILVRPGNPKNIRDFKDLTRPGIGIVHPDPLTSGGANWALIAEFGAGTRAEPDRPEAGYEMLLGIWRNVVSQAPSARSARTQFENGFGDALITYEQEVLWDLRRGKLKGEIVYPRSTVLSEHTLVKVERNIEPDEQTLMNDFVAYLWSEEAQRVFVQYGFRSVEENLNAANPDFKKIEDPFLIEDFGGWQKAKREIVDGVWKNRVLKELGK